MTLRLLNRFPFGRSNRPTRPNGRTDRYQAIRLVEVLEDRQLLSTVMPAGHHKFLARSHHHAIIELKAKRASQPSVTYYDAANTTDATSLPISGWQGIRPGDSPGQFLITGTSGTTGVLYVGSISGQGTSYAVNVTGASSTSVYGPNNLGGGQIQLVGSYRTADSSIVHGFFFQGTVRDGTVTGSYRTLDNPGATFNYIHSTMGGLAVGNSDGPTASGLPLGAGLASIYSVPSGASVANVKFPGSISDTAYGIWYNGGTSYTIVGGFSTRPVNNMRDQNTPIGKGYIVDFNSATNHFSHWKSLTYPNGTNILTHFEGISSPAPGVYTLSADSVQVGKAHVTQGSWVVVKRTANGSFGKASWVNLNYPGVVGWTSNDSVAGNQVVGIVIGNTGELTYQATVNTATL